MSLVHEMLKKMKEGEWLFSRLLADCSLREGVGPPPQNRVIGYTKVAVVPINLCYLTQ
jgi:hypothetical protein